MIVRRWGSLGQFDNCLNKRFVTISNCTVPVQEISGAALGDDGEEEGSGAAEDGSGVPDEVVLVRPVVGGILASVTFDLLHLDHRI